MENPKLQSGAAPLPWHALAPGRIFLELDSSKHGLTASEANRRLARESS
jgi:hypothetical protein